MRNFVVIHLHGRANHMVHKGLVFQGVTGTGETYFSPI